MNVAPSSSSPKKPPEIAQCISILIRDAKAAGLRFTALSLEFAAFALQEDIDRIKRNEEAESR
jgi:hypothetical protein